MNFKQLLFTACAVCTWGVVATAQVPSYVPTNGLVGWWPFNGNANDESGNGNDGVVNGATLTEDRNGAPNAAYSFDGVGYISGNDANFPSGNSDRSISFWAKPTLIDNVYHMVYGYGTYSSNNLCSFGIHNSNNNFYYSTVGNALMVQQAIADSLFHIAVIFSGGVYSFYVNGVFINSGFLPTNTILSSYYFGRDTAGNTGFVGVIDDIAIYNRALTEQEIQDLYIGCAVLPTSIAGELEPVTLSASSYACNNNAGSTYVWSVTNGVITAGQGTANITVLWGEEGAGALTVVETNAEGCSGTAVTIDVNVVCAISLTAINGPLGPNELTPTTYSCDGAGTSTYQWTITNGVISAGQGTSTVTVLWASTGLGSLSVQETTQANCTSDVISIDVVVIPTSIYEEAEAVLAVYPNPVQNEINIRSTLQAIGSNYTLYDGAGKLVCNGKINSTLTTIHAATLAAGTYVLHVGETFEQTIQVVR